MTIESLVQLLDESGVDVCAEDLLDALWLASRPVSLSSAAPGIAARRPKEGTPLPVPDRGRADQEGQARGADEERREAEADQQDADERIHAASGEAVLYSGGPVSAGDRTISASGIATPAARALPRRLELVRALRALRQKWPSTAVSELDEEATVELTANMWRPGARTIHPVTRPLLERWFECDLVLEADDAVEIWRDPLRDFAATLRDSGAFREVRSWRLRFPGDAAPGDFGHAWLETPAGARIAAGRLSGGIRRLILFATHGASLRWRDGSYARLLGNWARDANVAVIQLLPGDMWLRTALGEAQGFCATSRPGALASALDVEAHWWLPAPDPDGIDTLRLPVLELRPEAVEQWAAMLMARGRQAPLFLLNTRLDNSPPAAADQGATVSARLDALRESSPEGFRLAVLLSVSPFTIPVAHLVQEATFGAVDNRRLAELFLSGLIRSLPAEPDMPAAGDNSYAVIEEAKPLLRRSLRGTEASALAREVFERVSSHIAVIAGGQVTMASFTPDADGKYKIPVWAQPFARMMTSLVTVAPKPPAIEDVRLVDRLRETISERSLGLLARGAVYKRDALLKRIRPKDWQKIIASGVLKLPDGSVLDNDAHQELVDVDEQSPLLGLRIVWVDDRPTNNDHHRTFFTHWGATVVTRSTTETGIEALDKDVDLVISDMVRGDERRAGFALIEAAKSEFSQVPVIIYAGAFAASPQRRSETLRAGAYGCTNDGEELVRLVIAAARAEASPQARDEEESGDETGEPRPRDFYEVERQGWEALGRGDLDLAELNFRLQLESDEPDVGVRHRAFHNLGKVGERRGNHREAEDWHRRGLKLAEELSDDHYIEGSHRNLGGMAMAMGDLLGARDHYERALSYATRSAQSGGTPAIHVSLGEVALASGELDYAKQQFVRALETQHYLSTDATGRATDRLAYIARIGGDLDEAVDLYRRLLALGRETNNLPWLDTAFLGLGEVERSRGRWVEARGWFSEYANAAESVRDDARIAAAYGHLGSLSVAIREYDRAVDEYRKSLFAVERGGLKTMTADAHLGLAIAAEYAGRRSLAERHTGEAIALFERSKDRAGLARAQLNLADTMWALARLGEAETWYQAAAKTAEKGSYRNIAAMAWLGLGQVGQETGRRGAAESLYRDAIAAFEKLDDESGLAIGLQRLGHLLAISSRNGEAEVVFRRKLEIVERLGDLQATENTLAELGILAEFRGGSVEARSFYMQALRIAERRGDSMAIAEIRKAIEKMDSDRADWLP